MLRRAPRTAAPMPDAPLPGVRRLPRPLRTLRRGSAPRGRRRPPERRRARLWRRVAPDPRARAARGAPLPALREALGGGRSRRPSTRRRIRRPRQPARALPRVPLPPLARPGRRAPVTLDDRVRCPACSSPEVGVYHAGPCPAALPSDPAPVYCCAVSTCRWRGERPVDREVEAPCPRCSGRTWAAVPRALEESLGLARGARARRARSSSTRSKG